MAIIQQDMRTEAAVEPTVALW